MILPGGIIYPWEAGDDLRDCWAVGDGIGGAERHILAAANGATSGTVSSARRWAQIFPSQCISSRLRSVLESISAELVALQLESAPDPIRCPAAGCDPESVSSAQRTEGGMTTMAFSVWSNVSLA